jgi:hypothetical protein
MKPDQLLLVFRHALFPPPIPPGIPGAGESSGFPLFDGPDNQMPFGFVVFIELVIMGFCIRKVAE